MIKNKNSAVLFDFDGVIVDSFSLGYSIAKDHHLELSEEAYRALFEGNIYEMVEAAKERGELNDRDDKNHNAFHLAYGKRINDELLVTGMDAIIRNLAKQHHLAIVSSSIDGPIQQFLALHGILQYFDIVLGAFEETSKVKKINTALEKFDISAEMALFITDTSGDVREARKANVASVAVSWGFHDEMRLTAASPEIIIHSPEELATAVQQFFRK